MKQGHVITSNIFFWFMFVKRVLRCFPKNNLLVIVNIQRIKLKIRFVIYFV